MDIVERLRSPEVFIMDGSMISPVAFDAADEIERLRNAIKVQANAVRVLHEAETSELNRLRKNAQEAYTAKATLDSEREANKILTDEIERLRKALRLAGGRVEPLASFQQKDIGSSTIRVGEETKFSRDARSFNGEK